MKTCLWFIVCVPTLPSGFISLRPVQKERLIPPQVAPQTLLKFSSSKSEQVAETLIFFADAKHFICYNLIIQIKMRIKCFLCAEASSHTLQWVSRDSSCHSAAAQSSRSELHSILACRPVLKNAHRL